MAGTRRTKAGFQGLSRDFHTAKDAYIWLVGKFLHVQPTLLDNYVDTGTATKDFAHSPAELFVRSPHLAEQSSTSERIRGTQWYANTKTQTEEKFGLLMRLSALGGFSYGVDWTWDDGIRRPLNL